MPVKWTAPEVLFGDIAKLSSKSDVYELLLIKFQFFVCFFFFLLLLLFFGQRIIYVRENIRTIIFVRETIRKAFGFNF